MLEKTLLLEKKLLLLRPEYSIKGALALQKKNAKKQECDVLRSWFCQLRRRVFQEVSLQGHMTKIRQEADLMQFQVLQLVATAALVTRGARPLPQRPTRWKPI